MLLYPHTANESAVLGRFQSSDHMPPAEKGSLVTCRTIFVHVGAGQMHADQSALYDEGFLRCWMGSAFKEWLE